MSVSHYALLQIQLKTTTDFFPPNYTFARQALVIFSVLVLLKVVQFPGRRRRKMLVKSIVHTPTTSKQIEASAGIIPSIIPVYSAPRQGTVVTQETTEAAAWLVELTVTTKKRLELHFF